MELDKYRDRARGMLVGLAVGDALGAPFQFGNPSDVIEENIDKLLHMRDNNILPKGVWTDDTSMALCIADSLLEKNGYDSYDLMKKFCAWESTGYRSYFPMGYDEGRQTTRALAKYRLAPVIPANTKKEWSAGNGAIMRLAPIILANTIPVKKYNKTRITEEEMVPVERMAILSCRETHDSIAAECVTGMFAAVLFAALRGFDKTSICAYAEKGVYAQKEEYDKFWVDNVDLLINRWKNNRRDELRDLGGYIVDTYAIALWGFVNSSSFEDGMRKVLCLGGDSDTNAACYGQLAGAFYGYEAIPKEWRDDVYDAKEIVRLADALIKMESCPVLQTRFEDDEYFRPIKKSDIDKSVEYYARSSEPMSITELLKARFKKKA